VFIACVMSRHGSVELVWSSRRDAGTDNHAHAAEADHLPQETFCQIRKRQPNHAVGGVHICYDDIFVFGLSSGPCEQPPLPAAWEPAAVSNASSNMAWSLTVSSVSGYHWLEGTARTAVDKGEDL
jgi:hypothetical protein